MAITAELVRWLPGIQEKFLVCCKGTGKPVPGWKLDATGFQLRNELLTFYFLLGIVYSTPLL